MKRSALSTMQTCSRRARTRALHYGVSVVGQIDIKGRVHHFIGVVCRGISYHCDLVAELCREANGCFDAGVRDETNDTKKKSYRS